MLDVLRMLGGPRQSMNGLDSWHGPTWRTLAQLCARLHVSGRRGERDALIATTGTLVHGIAAVTSSAADFKPTRVTLVNLWKQSP